MKIYFDKKQFLEAEKFIDDKPTDLNNPIEYIESDYNAVLIANQEDIEDWETLQDNPNEFVFYVEQIEFESMSEYEQKVWSSRHCGSMISTIFTPIARMTEQLTEK